ncbi:hypothetical protein ACFWR4_11120 [Streptomyces hydrogenans]|uniref:hypothetical protein n=1 Tax=Streptomyces hydrogenans TaxID=1873719 RepID=UPI0036467FE9
MPEDACDHDPHREDEEADHGHDGVRGVGHRFRGTVTGTGALLSAGPSHRGAVTLAVRHLLVKRLITERATAKII